MNKLRLASVLIGLTLVLAACSDTDKSNYSGMGGDNGGNLPSDNLNTSGDNTGLQENARPPGNFNPDTDVDYTTLNAETIYFAFDSSTIPGQEQGKLTQVADWMKANPGHSLFLAGHADKRGTPEYNRALGERRALSVREYLVGLGLPAGVLYTNSYGSDRPAVEGDTEEAYAKNRRVQVGIITQGQAPQQQ
jgi:outer membrane protein OmpA-like peptidoglycan-associated protein